MNRTVSPAAARGVSGSLACSTRRIDLTLMPGQIDMRGARHLRIDSPLFVGLSGEAVIMKTPRPQPTLRAFRCLRQNDAIAGFSFYRELRLFGLFP
jgi:hypothetical protein